ncbi:hypothetical protein ES703_58825 [subsurface metagenome]
MEENRQIIEEIIKKTINRYKKKLEKEDPDKIASSLS